jgi:hypothetical protein
MVHSVLELIGVDDGPADPLDQLAREVVGLEIGGADPLSVDDGVGGVLGRVGDYEDLGHGGLLRLGDPTMAEEAWPLVKIE